MWTVIDMGIRIVMLGVVPGNRRPTTAMAWLLAIFFIPILGLALFLLFGNFRMSRRRTLRQAVINERVLSETKHLDLDDEDQNLPGWVHSAVAMNRRLGGMPLVRGNSVEFLTDYRESIQAMTEAVRTARSYVHVEFYIVGDDDEVVGPFLDALVAAADRGVNVRFLFDHLGTMRVSGYRKLLKRLDDSKISYRRMLPLAPVHGQWRRPDLRNHRKIVVVDGTVAFTGSQNLIEPGYKRAASRQMGREWVELMARVRGPLVASLDVVFTTDWSQETDENLLDDVRSITPLNEPGAVSGQLVPSGPGFSAENNLRLFTTLIYSATRELRITSPYFVPDDSLLYAVTTAAQRGVKVKLYVSERGDQALAHHAQQSYYRSLLTAGVEIYLYEAPHVLHTKCFTVDNEVAVFGSSNMDMRSFSLNFEISMMLLGPEIVERLDKVMDEYESKSKRVKLGMWNARTPFERWKDNVARLSATLQ
ncbi:cardiolipin synthase [Neomicrococcus aestuarii]|nr:cardiolipin synthase [Neomicrococcus aestuarii]APF41915.1 cardiolipin synthase [Neomicrococcus aestuarii]